MAAGNAAHIHEVFLDVAKAFGLQSMSEQPTLTPRVAAPCAVEPALQSGRFPHSTGNHMVTMATPATTGVKVSPYSSPATTPQVRGAGTGSPSNCTAGTFNYPTAGAPASHNHAPLAARPDLNFRPTNLSTSPSATKAACGFMPYTLSSDNITPASKPSLNGADHGAAMLNQQGGSSGSTAKPQAKAQPRKYAGVKMVMELCARPFSSILFLVRCEGMWPKELRSELLSWPGASQREGGQVSYPVKEHAIIESRLKELTKSTGLECDLLPSWVCAVAGYGQQDCLPTLGMGLDNAKKQVQAFLAGLPQELREQNKLLDYQMDGVAFGLHRGGRALIGDEMGLGKTVQALVLAAQYDVEWPVLVVAPSSLRFVWKDQAAKWLPHLVGEDGHLAHVIRNGKDRPPPDARIIIATYDLLRRNEVLRVRPDGRAFLIVIVDESQNIKDGRSLRTKAVLGLCKAARRTILLSGTPTLNRSSELYTQLEAVLPTEMPSFTQFAERYCVKEVQRFGHKTVEKWGGTKRVEELNNLLSGSIMIRRLKKEVLDQLPDKRRMRVPLDPEKMDQNVLHDVEKRVKMLGVRAERAFDDGGAQSEPGFNMPELFRLTAEAKMGAVIDYVGHLLQLGAKFLVFGHHHSTLDLLERKLSEDGIAYIRIDGSTPPGKRPKLVERFQEDEQVRVAVLSITAAGTGLTLTAAQTVVFAELYWVPGCMQQAEDRAHRIGQRSSVSVQYLIAKGTLDDVLYRSLERKARSTSGILDGLQSGMRATGTTLDAAAVQATRQATRASCAATLESCGSVAEEKQSTTVEPVVIGSDSDGEDRETEGETAKSKAAGEPPGKRLRV